MRHAMGQARVKRERKLRELKQQQEEQRLANKANPTAPVEPPKPTKRERRMAEREAREGPLDLEPIKARERAAEPGPWFADNYSQYVFLRSGNGPVTDSCNDEEAAESAVKIAVEEFRTILLEHLEQALPGRGALDDVDHFVRNLQVPTPRFVSRIRGFGRGAPQQSNNEFIAESRTDVPALVREVEKLRKQLDEQRRTREHLAIAYKKAFEALDSIACLTSEGREVMKVSEIFDAVQKDIRTALPDYEAARKLAATG